MGWTVLTDRGKFDVDPTIVAERGPCAESDCVPNRGFRQSFPLPVPGVVGDETRLTLADLGTMGSHHGKSRQRADSCWSHGFHPKLCCQPVWGSFHTCFDEVFTFERCCGSMVYRELPEEHIGHSISTAPALEHFTIDILVRAFHAERVMLELLVESVLIFWPAERWKSRVLLVLDAESERDHEMCKNFPPIVECHFEEMPRFLKEFSDFELTGGCRAMWSLHYADHYSGADYIAIVDADSVFHTFGIEQILFDRSGPPRPVLFGFWGVLYLFNPLVLGLDFAAEFMDSYPFTMRREHFRALRSFITDRMNAQDFDSAYEAYIRGLARAAWQRAWWTVYATEFPSFHQTAGSYLWEHHRDDYFWSIRYGALLGLPTQHTCPSLRVATHMAESGGDALTGKIGRVGLPNGTFPHDYKARAYAVMATGLGQGDGDAGLREMLLSARAGTSWHRGIGHRDAWPEEAAVHCKRRGLEDLWQAYKRLDVDLERAASLHRLYGVSPK